MLVAMLRRLPEMALIPREILEKMFVNFWSQRVPAGQVLVPEGNWYCVLSGALDIVRFLPYHEPADETLAPSVSVEVLQQDDRLILQQLPPSLAHGPTMESVGTLSSMASFRSGDSFGPYRDGWLVANSDTELLCCPLRTLRFMERRSQSRESRGDEVAELRHAPLLEDCPEKVIQQALEVLELREVVYGQDPLKQWPGLCIIRTGQLRLAAQTAASDAQSSGALALDSDASVAVAGVGRELCVLGPGDAVCEELIIGGPRLPGLTSSMVISANLEAWFLPQERRHEVEGSCFEKHLLSARDGNYQRLQKKVSERAAWIQTRERALAEVQFSTQNRPLSASAVVRG